MQDTNVSKGLIMPNNSASGENKENSNTQANNMPSNRVDININRNAEHGTYYRAFTSTDRHERRTLWVLKLSHYKTLLCREQAGRDNGILSKFCHSSIPLHIVLLWHVENQLLLANRKLHSDRSKRHYYILWL